MTQNAAVRETSRRRASKSTRHPRSKYPDAGDFARGLAWLLENDRWREQGRRGCEHVARTFATEIAIERHIAVYREHLGAGRGTGGRRRTDRVS